MPEQGPDWFLVATEACSGGTPDLSSVLEVLGYVGIYGCRGYVGGPPGGSRRRGARPGGRARTLPRVFPIGCLTYGPSLLDLIRSENDVPVGFIPFGLRLIFLFYETLK